MAHFLIAAPHRSSGKTTISIGLAGALSRRAMRVQAFKKGPDYIDPMWLARATGRPAYNLDFNTMNRAEIGTLFATHGGSADVALIETNMGLFDGLDPAGSDSNAALAKLLGAPVLLVVDATGMARGVAPLLQGYAGFDPDLALAGVILNRVSTPRHEAKLRDAVERYTDLRVLGAVASDPDLAITERHLGLATPGETNRLDARIDAIVNAISAGVDLDAILEVSALAPAITAPAGGGEVASSPGRMVRIAIARDAAFGFYYPDDLAAFERAGAELVAFDSLRDNALPPADGLFIGGGFPETQMAALEANTALRHDIKTAIAGGMATYAECGGLMYLCRRIIWRGARHDMVGAVDADAVMHEKPRGRGYVRLRERAEMPWPGAGRAGAGEIAAHEFHYCGLERVGHDDCYGYDVTRGTGIDGTHDAIILGNLVAGFAHLRDTEACRWVSRFVAFVRENSR